MNKNGLVNGPVKVLSDHLSGHFGIFVKYWPDKFGISNKEDTQLQLSVSPIISAHVSLQVMYYLIPL